MNRNEVSSAFAALRRDEGEESDPPSSQTAGTTEDGGWEFAEISEIEWVRLVRDRGCVLGIGFRGDQLVQFIGVSGARCQVSSGEVSTLRPDQIGTTEDGSGAEGLVRRVSVDESAFVLGNLAGLELNDQPDVESNPFAWRRWLRMIAK